MKNDSKCTGKNRGEGKGGIKGARINVLNQWPKFHVRKLVKQNKTQRKIQNNEV